MYCEDDFLQTLFDVGGLINIFISCCANNVCGYQNMQSADQCGLLTKYFYAHAQNAPKYVTPHVTIILKAECFFRYVSMVFLLPHVQSASKDATASSASSTAVHSAALGQPSRGLSPGKNPPVSRSALSNTFRRSAVACAFCRMDVFCRDLRSFN